MSLLAGVLAALVGASLLAGSLPRPWTAGLSVALGLALALGGHSHGAAAHIDRLAHTSRWAGLNAGLKTAGCCVLLILTLCCRTSWPPLGLFVYTALLCMAGGVGVRRYLGLLALPAAFLLLSAAALLWHWAPAPGGLASVPFLGGWLVLDAAGQATARLVVARALGALGCLYWLSLSTPLPEVLEVLRRVHVPGPVLDLAVLIYRYIFVMLDTAARMRVSAASRLGYEGAGRSLRTTGLVYANLLGRSFGRARVCQQAMESRGWEGDIRFLVRKKPVRAAHLIPFAAPAAVMLLALGLGG